MQTYIFRRPTFGGRFLCPFLLCSLAQPHTGGILHRLICGRLNFFCSQSLKGGRIFTYYSTSAAERQSYLPAKFVSPQNAPFRTQNAFAFFTEGGRFIQNVQAKNISDPPRPSAAGGAGHSAPSTLVVPCACALRRGVRTSTCSACKMRLFLHIFPMQGIKLPSTGQTIGEDPNGCAAELHMMI